MKYATLCILFYLCVGCNLIPNEDPNVNMPLISFTEAVKTSDDTTAWNLLSSEVQTKLDEATFRTLVSTGAGYENLIELFRTANITTRNITRDIKTEHYWKMTNPSGSDVAVRFVMTQEPDGTWRVANLLAE